MKSKNVFVISRMNKQSGEYENFVVFTGSEWKEVKSLIDDNWLIRIEWFQLGNISTISTFHSVEEFENEINF